MAMTTRCPHCGTAFKVVADQLRVRNGLVRCGVCSRVFDGFAAVVDGPAPRSAWPDAPADAAETPGAASPVLSVRAGAEAATPPPASPVAAPAPPAVPAPPPMPPVTASPAMTHSPPWRAETSPGFSSPYEPHEPRAPYVPDVSDDRHGLRPDPARHETYERHEPRSPYLPPVGHRPAVPAGAAVPAPRDSGLAGAASAAEPAVLRGRDDNRRVVPSRDEPALSSDAPPAARDRDDDDDAYGYREPYAPYRQDDLGDAEQQARDMASSRDSRFSIYARRDPIEDDEPVYVPVPGEARTRYDDMTDAGMAPPIFMDEEVQRRRTLVGRLWAAGCLLGLVVLALQWVYIYRTPIATAVPALRPALETMCAQLGCQLGYARRLERISITASSLQPQPGAAAEDGRMRLVLAVTLRNRYDKPQPWPALMLQLTDLSDTVVVRKVLLPENYLPPGAPGFFAAGGEQSLSVPLQVNGPHVNGYQLDKFFP